MKWSEGRSSLEVCTHLSDCLHCVSTPLSYDISNITWSAAYTDGKKQWNTKVYFPPAMFFRHLEKKPQKSLSVRTWPDWADLMSQFPCCFIYVHEYTNRTKQTTAVSDRRVCSTRSFTYWRKLASQVLFENVNTTERDFPTPECLYF